MRFDEAVARLERALDEPLPGAAAQNRLAPRPPREAPEGFAPARIRDAAGLLLVFADNARAHIVLTVRAESLGRHGGQVSLPGGVVNPGETFAQAALREAHEEIALDPTQVRVLGRLTALDILVSGFRLHPIVGAAHHTPALHPADGEVARILSIGVHELLGPDVVSSREMRRDQRTLIVPAFHVHGAEIWGATAMVLAEFLALLGWNGPERRG